MEITQEKIKEKFESLPEDVKQAISSIETTNIIIGIGDENKIQIDEIGELVDETGLVMLGFTKPNDFVGNVRSRLNISNDLAEKIAKEINDKVLLRIRESLKKISEPVQVKEPIEIPKNYNSLKSNQEKSTQNEFISEEEWLNPLNHSKKIDKEQIEQTEQHEELEREKVLKDIEEPENIIEKTQEIIERPENSLTKPKENEIIENKLKGIVKMPVEKKEVSDKPKVIDPYREPID